ncbi:acetamidase/formamidase family protein [Paludibaculum fermentans]|uniref:acetamidase/formamidase family protein n=1 Tax=Paludibaculum fermentans TaxID=1473598 RepID=UPI003EBACD19
MCRLLFLLFLMLGALPAQTTTVSGRWLVTADFHGTPLHYILELAQQKDALTGKFDGNPLEGGLLNGALEFFAKDERGNTTRCTARVAAGSMAGSLTFTDVGDPQYPTTRPFTARPVSSRSAGGPRRHDFQPKVFHREFSAANTPVLTIAPGDSVHTTTVDASGIDEKGVTHVLGGNPQTGPFYIETAVPGDTLVVRLSRLRLNRDWALSTDAIVERGLNSGLASIAKDNGKAVRWRLDLQRGVATPSTPTERLKNYSVPLRPMLGCIGVAPSMYGWTSAPTHDSGSWGGNMDFNEVVEGATIYLPVQVPGALLYLGDGHAVQGDGELTGDALETSMDVEFTVDVLPGKRLPGPRVESASHIMALGYAGSLDDAFRSATAGMAQWLADDYSLTASEVAQVLGTAAEYKVTEVADRNAGIVLKVDKERLRSLAKARN